MNSFTRYILFSFLFATAGLLAFPANAQDIVVGEFASLTGSEATFGINSSNGVELAKQEINNSGGLLEGWKIKIIVEDDQSSPGQPSAVMARFALDNLVVKKVAILQNVKSDYWIIKG